MKTKLILLIFICFFSTGLDAEQFFSRRSQYKVYFEKYWCVGNYKGGAKMRGLFLYNVTCHTGSIFKDTYAPPKAKNMYIPFRNVFSVVKVEQEQ